MKRKYQRMKFIETIHDKTSRDRIPAFLSHKRLERDQEFDTLCKLIELTCCAVENNTREWENFNFTNSWIKCLSHFALDEEGYLLPNWRQKTWQVVCNFGGNQGL